MNRKKLKPTSTHFLSQKFWRYLRRILNRDLWTYLYISFQKFKFSSTLRLIKDDNLNQKEKLNYPNQRKKLKNKIHSYSFYLKKYNSSKPKGKYRKYLDKVMKKINPNTVLEFGISEGAGLLSMNEYFKNSYFWGLDIDRYTFIKKKNFVCGFCDQLNISSIRKILKKFNTKFDLIIDDGWHHPQSQMNSIICSLPYLNYGGVYITEDIAHDAYKKNINKLVNMLRKKKFKVIYKKFTIKNRDANLAGTDNNGYLFIYRLKN